MAAKHRRDIGCCRWERGASSEVRVVRFPAGRKERASNDDRQDDRRRDRELMVVLVNEDELVVYIITGSY